MERYVDIWRAARLAGVSRAEIQERIAEGELESFEGRVDVAGLRRLYPDAIAGHGLIIDFVGLPTGAEPGTIPVDVIFDLGLIAGPILSATLILPCLCLLKLNLGRARHAEIRRALDAREPDSAA